MRCPVVLASLVLFFTETITQDFLLKEVANMLNSVLSMVCNDVNFCCSFYLAHNYCLHCKSFRSISTWGFLPFQFLVFYELVDFLLFSSDFWCSVWTISELSGKFWTCRRIRTKVIEAHKCAKFPLRGYLLSLGTTGSVTLLNPV